MFWKNGKDLIGYRVDSYLQNQNVVLISLIGSDKKILQLGHLHGLKAILFENQIKVGDLHETYVAHF